MVASKKSTVAKPAGTATRILDVAENLVQVRGFNAFSYADVAKAVGIQKASLHHHFATKTDLGVALVLRYRRTFLDALDSIEASSSDGFTRIQRYADLYGEVLRDGRMCMCGMLASDVATLPRPMRGSIANFFAENETWLARVLAEGKKRGEVAFDGAPASMAAFIVSSLEGAMLVARGSGDLDHFDEVVQRLLERVRPQAAKSKRRTG
jgi:TetR/AcrR family transcriptional repressor of nem operon